MRKNTNQINQKHKKNKNNKKSFLQKKKNLAISRSIKNTQGLHLGNMKKKPITLKNNSIFESLID